jgi:hypothetical protein
MNNKDKELIERCVRNTPLALLNIINEEHLRYASKFVPYSTGFEIECELKDKKYASELNKIPDLINYHGGGWGEERFRIPSGVKGIVCVYNISRAMKEYALFNPGSGIHYHIDFTDGTYDIPPDFINENKRWILSDLDEWNYGGSYNKREVSFYKGNWFVFRGNTIEIRIGNMTFDYKELIRCIIDGNRIVRKVKSLLSSEEHVLMLDEKAYSKVDKEQILLHLSGQTDTANKRVIIKDKINAAKQALKNITEKIKPVEPTIDDLKKTINSRIE